MGTVVYRHMTDPSAEGVLNDSDAGNDTEDAAGDLPAGHGPRDGRTYRSPNEVHLLTQAPEACATSRASEHRRISCRSSHDRLGTSEPVGRGSGRGLDGASAYRKRTTVSRLLARRARPPSTRTPPAGSGPHRPQRRVAGRPGRSLTTSNPESWSKSFSSSSVSQATPSTRRHTSTPRRHTPCLVFWIFEQYETRARAAGARIRRVWVPHGASRGSLSTPRRLSTVTSLTMAEPIRASMRVPAAERLGQANDLYEAVIVALTAYASPPWTEPLIVRFLPRSLNWLRPRGRSASGHQATRRTRRRQ